jgi:hypothetical protein
MNSRLPKWYEPCTDFDYTSLDVSELPELDQAFWSAQGELLHDVLLWLTEANNLSSVGARCLTLCLYLRPELIRASSLRELSKMENAPTAACLSKALCELEEKYGLRPGCFQKPAWARERFRRSAIAAHLNRQSPPSQDAP